MEDSDHQDYIAPLESDIERLEEELERLNEKFDALNSCYMRDMMELKKSELNRTELYNAIKGSPPYDPDMQHYHRQIDEVFERHERRIAYEEKEQDDEKG